MYSIFCFIAPIARARPIKGSNSTPFIYSTKLELHCSVSPTGVGCCTFLCSTTNCICAGTYQLLPHLIGEYLLVFI